MLTQCLPSTGSNSIVLVIMGVTAVAFGIAMTRWSKARTSALVALLVLGMLAVSGAIAKPASAACSTSTTIPTTTVPETFVTGTIFGVPYPTDDCTDAGWQLWHCVSTSTPNPDTAANWVSAITATNTVTSEVINATITDALSQGSTCLADCGMNVASRGLTGQIHFTLPGVTSGTWKLDVTYVRSAYTLPASTTEWQSLRIKTHQMQADSVVQSTTNTGIVGCAEESMSSPAVPLTSTSMLSIYLTATTLYSCYD